MQGQHRASATPFVNDRFEPIAFAALAFAAGGTDVGEGLFVSMLPGSRKAAFQRYGDRGHRDR